MSSNEEDGGGNGDSFSDSDSAVSSYNSGDYGTVARSGFTRMYVLSHSSHSPFDKSGDYRSEFSALDAKDSESKNHVDSDSSRATAQTAHYQLTYASGCHYFHNSIELPEGVGSAGRSRSTGHDEDQDDDILDEKSKSNPHGLSITDLPILLPHFQTQQDALVAVESLAEFRSEVRDVLYQMEEVGAFMVEELAKDKTIARIEQASHELHWIVSPHNPTFFELQTFSRANDDLEEAGVVLVVMKIVVREVLLDVIYHSNSYFVTLRENNDELALEDTFIPNGTVMAVCWNLFAVGGVEILIGCVSLVLSAVSCVGPCLVVRSYSDDDIKKLVLWCALPVSDMDEDLVVEGKALQLQPQLSSSSSAKSNKEAKVKPVIASRDARAILEANDTQMYCLLPLSSLDRKRKLTITSSREDKRKTKNKHASRDEEDKAEGDEERRELVVFQFNQYVYHGELWICPNLLDDLAKLSTHVFPHLRAQSHSLAFYGETEDLPSMCRTDDDAGPMDKMAQFAGVRHRLQELAPTLLTLLVDSQAWIQDFLTEVDTIVATEDSTSSAPSSSPISSEWLARHLKAWLEVDNGMEAFFELELGCDPLGQSVFGDFDEAQVELMVWKGIVNAAIMVVVYRKGSFYMMLRDQPCEGDPLKILDATELFGAIPALGSKGRGYLVRKFPTEISQCKSQAWLAGAKLLLWQTSASLAREELREAQAKEKHRSKKQQTLCADWFEHDEAVGTTAPEAEAKVVQAKSVASSTDTIRLPERTDEKSHHQQQSASEAKGHRETAKASAPPLTTDKVSRRHHIPPLSSAHAAPVKITTTAPWDLHTGRPL